MLSTILLYKMVLYLKKCTNDTGSTWSTVEPDTPWLTIINVSQRPIRFLIGPEKKRVIGMAGSVNSDVPCKATHDRKRDIGERFSNLKVYADWVIREYGSSELCNSQSCHSGLKPPAGMPG